MSDLPATMRALRLEVPGRLTCVALPTPAPSAGELLVRTAATTICASDLSDMRDNPFGLALPRVLGHEASGTVEAVGANVSGFRRGDRVASHPVIPCGQCAECRRGLGHLCLNMGHLAVDRDGTFAEFFCIPAARSRKIPDSLDAAEAALLEPVAVCLEAVRRVRLQAAERVLIAGDGPFGVMIARMAARLGARAILTGRHDFRLERAREAETINIDRVSDPAKAVREAAGDEGVDAAILAVDSQEALDLCIASLRPRGRLAVFAVMPGKPRVDMLRLLVKELEIVGACNDEDRLDEALDLIVRGALGLGQIVTHRIGFDRWEQAIELAADRPGEALKVAIVFDDPR